MPVFAPVRSLIAAAGLAGAVGVSSSHAADKGAPMETKALHAIIVDGETGAILLEKDADAPFPPASLAKLMTMEVVFQALEDGTLRLGQTFPVSEHAWRTGGAPSGTSTMFAKIKSEVPLDALIKGTIVQAANDAGIVIAEGISGSEAGFAERMNETAKAIGLKNSRFVNPTGLPEEGQVVTVRDLSILARHIRSTHTDLYQIYSQPDFEWNGIKQRNRNPLLALDIGATGMGTGFTEASGYSLVGVKEKDGRTTFIALGGLTSVKERAEEARRLLEWTNGSFKRQELYAANALVGTAAVYGGVVASVPVEVQTAVIAYVPKEGGERVAARIVYEGPLQAPVEKGATVGTLEVRIDGKTSISFDVRAAESVDRGTFASRAFDAAQELAFGWIKAL